MNRTAPSAVPLSAAPSDRSSWPYWLGTAAAVFLGAVFLVATWGKAIDPGSFAEQIRLEGLDFALPAIAVAWIALALEAGVGIGLLVALRRLWLLVPAAALVVFFLGLTGRAWYLSAHGLREDVAGCGCFGNLVERSPAEAFWQDLLLLGVPMVLAFLGRPRGGRRFPPVRTALVGIGALAALALAWKAPELPLDDLATRLSPGVEVAALCAGGEDDRVCLDTLAPELAAGEHLVIVADLEAPDFTGAVDALNDYAVEARGRGGAPVVVLSSATPEVHRGFFWRWGPVFEVREVPEALLAPLYRRLPRSFRTVDGRVVETWSGLPPVAAEAAGEGDPTVEGRARPTD